MDDLTIEALTDDTDYDLQRSDYGEGALNPFLTTHLVRQHRNKTPRAYILCRNTPEHQVLGYYTLCDSCFEQAALSSKSEQKRIPCRSVPGITFGRLVTDCSLQEQGWGATLAAHAIKIAWSASLVVGIRGLFTEVLNKKAHMFYQSLGFIPLVGENENALFSPTKSIELLFTQSN